MRATRFVLSALALAVAAPALPAHAAALLAPHRAVYDLSLDETSEQSAIAGIAGRMVYEFKGSACDGYTVTFRFVTRIDTDEDSRMSDMQTTTYEDPDGRSFSFATKSFVDRLLDKEVKGTATAQSDATAVRIEKPEPKSVSIEKTQFPTQHLLELIEKAKQSENFYETTIFDGSDEADKVMTTTVVIGRQQAAQARDPERNALDGLADDGFWPVEIAYFDLSEGNGEEIPSYRIAFKLHENGVTRDLLMDYGDFAMKGQLVDLELLKPAAACSQ
jgi:hypothetical protein